MTEEILSGNGWITTSTGPATVTCQSWNGFIDFLHAEKALKMNNSYYFRGHASESWELKSTLGRAIRDAKIIDPVAFQNNILTQFKKYALGRRGHNPAQLSDNEWWALGQHFGLKTPLLDWTESPYVAAFFAFSSANCDDDDDNVVIWALGKNVNISILNNKSPQRKSINFVNPYLDENSRLINQRGLFVHLPEKMDISDYINQITIEDSIQLAKIKIPARDKTFALDSLDKMNINNLTLFPDLSGAALHANYDSIANK